MTASGQAQPVLPSPKDVIVGELAEPGEWIVVSVDAPPIWPIRAEQIVFFGWPLWVLPIMQNFAPGLAMRRPTGLSVEDCERLLMRLLSAISWSEERGFLVSAITTGSRPAPIWRQNPAAYSYCEAFDLSYLPEASDPKALLALALMREGRGLNHPAYAFLSYWRVLETALTAKERGSWIDATMAGTPNARAKEALDELRAKGVTNVGQHLREARRLAIAHAQVQPIIDPDDPSHTRDVRADLPLIEWLAEKAVEGRLGVETRWTQFDRHLYELAGFKKLLGDDIVKQVSAGLPSEALKTLQLPNIDLALRRLPPYPSLRDMSLMEIRQSSALVELIYMSKRQHVVVQILLDFADERLWLNPIQGMLHRDDGSPEAAEDIAEKIRFSGDLAGNGQLLIYGSESGELIARKDAFVPVNAFVDADATKALIAEWTAKAVQRRP